MIENLVINYLDEGIDQSITAILNAVARYKVKQSSYASIQALTAVENLLLASVVAEDNKTKRNLIGKATQLFGFAKTVR